MDGLRRVLVSLGSVAVAVLVTWVVMSWAFERRIDPGWFFLIAVFAVPGWVVSIPMVLAMRRFEGWRFWVSLVAGTMIGPVIVALLHTKTGVSSWVNGAGMALAYRDYLFLAAGVSFIGTSIYLYVYRTDAVRAREWRW